MLRSRKFWKGRSRKFGKIGIGVEVGNFGTVAVRVGHFTFDPTTLLAIAAGDNVT